jgi:hypothetical protein
MYRKLSVFILINIFYIGSVYAEDIPVSNNKKIALESFKNLASETSSSTGEYSFSLGEANQSLKDHSFTTGKLSRAFSSFSQAHGQNATVNSDYAYAFGNSVTVAGKYAEAHGQMSFAAGDYSMTFGHMNATSGAHSLAFGKKNETGDYSFAFGLENFSTGEFSYALGKRNNVVGSDSYSFGHDNELSNVGSYAFGSNISSSALNAITLGHSKSKLVNNVANSLMVAFNSNLPTLFVSSSYGDGTTGTVGIGTSEISRTVSLHVKGSVLIDDGNQAKGKILVSDEKGKAHWLEPKELGIVQKTKETKKREKFVDNLEKRIETDDDSILIGSKERPSLYVDQSQDNSATGFNTNFGNVGVGTSSPRQKLHISGAMRLEPQDIAPTNPSAGDIYYDKSGAFCGYIIDQSGRGYWDIMIGSGYCNG